MSPYRHRGYARDATRPFFKYARERYRILLARRAGRPRPWTKDPILQSNRFTNIFREDDRVTQWFRQHVREPRWQLPEVIPATVIFRWFNRISTGEALFSQTDLLASYGTVFDQYLERKATLGDFRRAIVNRCGRGPYVTGAYTINTISAGRGVSKLDGVLWLIDDWMASHNWRAAWESGGWSVEAATEWIKSTCLGPFMAYEVATDLSHTMLLCRAPDLMTWANPGPGAKRGLNRVMGRPVAAPVRESEALELMRGFLRDSQRNEMWPNKWPPWSMREVEHTLCEFDKYERVRLGQGRPRGSFNGGAL
jgi:hypothetical protein